MEYIVHYGKHIKENKMGDWQKTEFTKFTRIRPETLENIKAIKGKKSIAGKIDELADFYITAHNLQLTIKNANKNGKIS